MPLNSTKSPRNNFPQQITKRLNHQRFRPNLGGFLRIKKRKEPQITERLFSALLQVKILAQSSAVPQMHTHPSDLRLKDSVYFLVQALKFLSICSPLACDFSGWNWVAKRLSFQTQEQ